MKKNFVNSKSSTVNRNNPPPLSLPLLGGGDGGGGENCDLRFAICDLRSRRGVSIYLVFVIMSLFLAMSLGVSTILLRQLSSVRGLGDSVIAFYASETGIEKTLMQRQNPCPLDGYSETLDNDASYKISVNSSSKGGCPGGGCTAPNFCVKSVGSFQGTKRALQITY